MYSEAQEIAESEQLRNKLNTSEIVQTYQATIFVGLREGYDGPIHNVSEVEKLCCDYCTEVGLCVTVTPTRFCYKNGDEAGAIIGLINYPRFPSDPATIDAHAKSIAKRCLEAFGQNRVGYIAGGETSMWIRTEPTEGGK